MLQGQRNIEENEATIRYCRLLPFFQVYAAQKILFFPASFLYRYIDAAFGGDRFDRQMLGYDI